MMSLNICRAKDSPCRMCRERSAECHSVCERYAAYRKECDSYLDDKAKRRLSAYSFKSKYEQTTLRKIIHER